MVTGESVSEKQPGNEVIGATLNKTGSFKFRQRVGKDTFLAQIVKLVQQAQGSSTDSTTGRPVTRWFVPAVIATRSLPLHLVIGNVTMALITTVGVLIIASPSVRSV